jgi:hypothetical protein
MTSSYVGRDAARLSIANYLAAKNAEATGHLPEAALAFAASLAIPHDFPPWRMPQVYTTTPSCLAQPWSIDEQDWSLPQSPVDRASRILGLPDGEMLMVLTRSPLWARIQFVPNPTNALVRYDGRFAYDPACLDIGGTGSYGGQAVNPVGFSSYTYAQVPSTTIVATTTFTLPLVGFELAPTSAQAPHGEFMFTGAHDGKRGFYLPRAAGGVDVSSVNLIYTAVNSVTGAVLPLGAGQILKFNSTLYVLVGDDWVEFTSNEQEITSGGSTITATLSLNGSPNTVSPGEYVAVDLSVTANSATPLYIRAESYFVHNTSTFGHLCVPNLYEKRAAVGGLRPVAGAGMLSPNSALFNRQGLVRGVQLPPGQDWLTTVRGGFNGLNTAEGMWNGSWTKGIYGFIKPVGVSEFEMQSPFFKLSELGPYSPVTDATHPLRMAGGQVLLWAKTDLQTLGSGDVLYAAGQSYTTTLRCLEFRTLDTWFKQDVPALDQEELEIAMRLIAHMPQFHENPLHVAAITGFLRTAAAAGQFAFKHLPNIIKALPIIGEGIHKIREIFHPSTSGGPEVHAMPKGYRSAVPRLEMRQSLKASPPPRPATTNANPMLGAILKRGGRYTFTNKGTDDAAWVAKMLKDHGAERAITEVKRKRKKKNAQAPVPAGKKAGKKGGKGGKPKSS